jgi:hypothetical protein
MKKLLMVLTILGSTVFASFAQTTQPPVLLSIGADVGFATAPTNQTYASTTGLSFKFELPFQNQRLNLTLTAAYSNYNPKNTPATDTLQNGHYVPVEIGLKYFLYKNIYFEGDIGESFNINSQYMGYQSVFIYSPVAGISLPIQKNTAAIDMSVRYESRIESAGNINQVAFRVAYKFGL